jgi:hypothetical protein
MRQNLHLEFLLLNTWVVALLDAPRPPCYNLSRSHGMPTPLLETTVRPDWREYEQHQAARGALLWRRVQWTVVSLAAVTLAAALIPTLAPWQTAIRILTLTAAFWPLPITTIARTSRQALTYTGLALGAGALVALSAPLSDPVSSLLPGWAALPAALVSLGLLLAMPRAFSANAATLGLRRVVSPTGLLLGAAVGAGLGLHLWFIATLLPDRPAPAMPAGAALVWVVSWAALRAPGEELLFRGVGFRSLAAMHQGPLLRTAARLTLLNMFAYVAPGVSDPVFWLLTLPYAAAMAIAATLLRARDDSLDAAIACDFVFTLFLAGAVLT